MEDHNAVEQLCRCPGTRCRIRFDGVQPPELTFWRASRFVLLDNSFAAGQIAELKIRATNRFVNGRAQAAGSSWMVADHDLDFNFMKEFEYVPDTLGYSVARIPKARIAC